MALVTVHWLATPFITVDWLHHSVNNISVFQLPLVRLVVGPRYIFFADRSQTYEQRIYNWGQVLQV